MPHAAENIFNKFSELIRTIYGKYINRFLKPLIFLFKEDFLISFKFGSLFMLSFLQKIILLAFLIKSQFAAAQIKFIANTSATEIGKNDMLQLKLMVENAIEVQQITPPNLKNFIILSGPNEESGMTMINNDVKRYIALSYILKPKSVGNFIIASTTAKADGKDLRSNAITIKVSNSNTNNSSNNFTSPFAGIAPFDNAVPENPFKDNILKKGENIADKISKSMFVKLDVDKTSCYVGEPIIATYKLYTRLKSESNLTKSPSFNGFSVIDLQQPTIDNYTREKINGRAYNVYILRKAQLYPLQAGNLELESAEIENNISFIKENYAAAQGDAIDDLLRQLQSSNLPANAIETHKVTLQNKPSSVLVKALPKKNVPANFNGAVGNFSIEALPEKNIFTTDDVGRLKIIISGQGNLQLINNPEIQWPQGFEAFEPTTADDFVKTTVPVSGRKIIDYTFSIAQPGSYILPAIKFGFFNPKIAEYQTDSTKPIAFTVNKGKGKTAMPIVAVPNKNSSWLNKLNNNSTVIFSAMAALIIGLLFFWQNKKAKKQNQSAISTKNVTPIDTTLYKEFYNALENNWLAKAATLLQSGTTAFYTELDAAFKNYLSHKLNLPLQTINKKNIAEALDKKNISVSTAVQVQQLMNSIELQLYTPFADEQKKLELYSNTAALIEQLDTYKS